MEVRLLYEETSKIIRRRRLRRDENGTRRKPSKALTLKLRGPKAGRRKRGSSGANRCSREQTPRPNRNARRRTSDLDVLFDGHNVTALVDNGADYSVVSGPFATKLKKVRTAGQGPEIRTAGVHLLTPAGVCTARAVNNQTYPASFVILQHCSRDVILGMDFLSHHGGVINLRSELKTLISEKALLPHTTPSNQALSLIEEHVIVLRHSRVIISVSTEEPADLEGVIVCDQHLLLNRQIGVAGGIAELRDGKAKVVLTNLSHEYRHLKIGTTVAYIGEFVDASNAFALFDATEPAGRIEVPNQILT